MSDPEKKNDLEKQETPTPPEQNDEHHHHLPFHHLHHRKHRVNHLVHPSGKHFHVVHSHDAIDNKRRELMKDPKGAFADDYEIVVYGTPEHLSCVKDVRDHHMTRREALREKNAELFEEFDEIHDILNHTADELNQLTNHAVALDASFNKYGYSAHIRTKDDVESASLYSGNGDDSGEGVDPSATGARHGDRSIESVTFWKTPTVRQYYHKGLLWRSARSGEVGSFELFTDLIYVGVIDYIGEAAVTRASSETLLHFIVVFSLAYKIWSDLTVTVNWFEVEDVVGRLCIILVLCCLYGFNSNVEYFFSYTYTAGMAFYLTQRLLMVALYAIFSYVIPMVRGTLICQVCIGLAASVLYIVSIHVEYPNNLAPLFIGLFVDYFGGVLILGLVRHIKANEDKSTSKILGKHFEFLPSINIEHRVERTSAFTTLVFGYSILRSLYQSHAHIGMNAFLGKGLLVVIQTFAVLWIYFDIDALPIHVHAIRRHWLSTSLWITAHLPLSGAFILASSTLSEMVLAHDCQNSNPDDLAKTYKDRSREELEQPLRWFYCVGLAITLAMMTTISACHIHKKATKPRLPKTTRLAARLCVVAVLACLPLTRSLNSLHLIGTTTGLFVFVLAFELWGSAPTGSYFWTGGYANCPETRCKYTAKLKMGRRRKAELQRRLCQGEKVGLSDALNRSRTDSIGSETTLDVNEEWHGGHM